MPENSVNSTEVEFLLASVQKRYGVDLSGYTRKSLIRRVGHFNKKAGIKHFAELAPRVLEDRAFFLEFINDISVSVTEFFRDPQVFFAIRNLVLPQLKHLPYLKIWHAGCASGQEVYSLAILLHETGLLSRATIYATDISSAALDRGRDGIYKKSELLQSTLNYKKSGGTFDLRNYYMERYDHFRFHPYLRARVAFAQHDMVAHAHLSEINLLLCRNVFIYFDRDLQKCVMEKFSDSVIDGGFLVLGTSESLQFIDEHQRFEPFSLSHRIYQRKHKSNQMVNSEQ